MPSRRTRRSRHGGLSAYKVYELMTGLVMYPARNYSGYGDPRTEQQTHPISDDDLRMGFEASAHPPGCGAREYSSIEPFIDDGMRADWEKYRDALLRWWISGEYATRESFAVAGLDIKSPPWLFYRGYAGTRPWAWWQFDAPEPLGDEDEEDYLRRLDLLLPGELEELKNA